LRKEGLVVQTDRVTQLWKLNYTPEPSNKYVVNPQCPYCGNKNTVVTLTGSVHPQLVVCDWENGGCEKAFAVEIKVKVEAKTYTLNIA